MSRIRSLSSLRLVLLVVAVGGLAVTAAVASAALGGGETPPPRPLAEAVHRAATAPPPAGVSARIDFSNRLLPAGALPEGEAPPLLAGASGRLWARPDGRFRLELQSRRGDAQVASDGRVLTLYDASSKTVYRAEKPEGLGRHAGPSRDHGGEGDQRRDGKEGDEDRHRPPTLDEIERKLAQLSEQVELSGARPESRAGRPAYSVRLAPRNDGGLLGAAEVAWDAVRGVPLRAAVYAQGESEPVLDLSVTDVSYDAVPISDVTVEPPAGARVVRVDPPRGERGKRFGPKGRDRGVRGLDKVRKALPFDLAAPDKLAGLPRREVRLIDHGGRPGALVVYGRGLGAIAVIEQPAQRPDERREPAEGPGRELQGLPQISVDGATGTELATALGTLVRFEREGVSYAVVGSVPPVAAETAARELR